MMVIVVWNDVWEETSTYLSACIQHRDVTEMDYCHILPPFDRGVSLEAVKASLLFQVRCNP